MTHEQQVRLDEPDCRARPEARMMKHHEGPRLGYNAQVVVDAPGGIIVASEVSTDANDKFQMRPMLAKVQEGVRQVAEETVADAGCFSGEQLAAAERAEYPVLVNLQGGDSLREGSGVPYLAVRR